MFSKNQDPDQEHGSEQYDPFIGADIDVNPLPKDAANTILGVDTTDTGTPTPKFIPPPSAQRFNEAAKLSEKISAQQTPEKEEQTAHQRLAALEQMIMKLREGIGEVKVTNSTSKNTPIDFSKLTEDSVYDLSIPMETVDHYIPDYTKIELKDSNYIARWINMHAMRIGPMKQAGFTYITEEDLASPLEMEILPDENGHYKYIDVVAMKTPKDKYLRALRTNYLRALAQTQQKKVHQLAQQVTENALMMGTSEEKAPMGQAVEFQKRKAAGQMNIYSPNL